ncbi:MAG: alkaline phosphatase [Cellulosilyticaceae bacterium]
MKISKKLTAILIGSIMVGTATLGFGISSTPLYAAEDATIQIDNATYIRPKYIFTFIGDGMSYVQLNAANIYQGVTKNGSLQLGDMAISNFPVVGSATTQDATSFCPDSASTATALSSGIKTHSGVIGYNADRLTTPESITEKLQKEGYKIGIVSSVSIDHATPAAYYAHEISRGNMYNIALQLAASNFDYFAGGSLVQPNGKSGEERSAFEIIAENGYTITDNNEDFFNLTPSSGKVYAINPDLQESSAMHYALDSNSSQIQLKDYVEKGIELLDNENGFFMMVEGGKIDWAGHANDARANIGDVLALDEAIQVAVDFANKHPDETLILVTGDHETGGMSIGQATTGYDTTFELLSYQQMSYVEFDKVISTYKETASPTASLTDLLPIIAKNFGLVTADNSSSAKHPLLVLSDYEYKKLEDAYAETMKSYSDRSTDESSKLLYGGYEPLTVTLTHILNNKSGIGWTSYSHTGVPVPVYAMGIGQEIFNGSYENTDVFNKLVTLCGLN